MADKEESGKPEIPTEQDGYMQEISNEDYLNDTDIQNALTGQGQVDALGRRPVGYEEKWNPYVSDNKTHPNVLGLPLYYNNLADPSGRVYNDTIMGDLSLVFLVPGKPSINKKLVGSDNKKISTKQLKQQINDYEKGTSDAIRFAVRGVTGYADLRYIGFKPAYREYYENVQVMLSSVHSMMGLEGIFLFSDEFKNQPNNYGLAFHADKSTSISESANNEYGQSKVVEGVNAASAELREKKMLSGMGSSFSEFNATSTGDLIDQMSSTGIFSRAINAMGRVVNGSQLLYPEIWNDSKFDRSYNISFKFYSPYGDRSSIFKYVYVPFISLLALALPLYWGN